MNSELNEHLAEARVADWRRDADRFRQVHAGSGESAESVEAVTVRYARRTDAGAIAHIANLDGRQAPSGRTLVAEVDGRVLVALSVQDGSSVADPFRPTAHLTELLELRAAHLRDSSAHRWRRWSRRRALSAPR